MMTRRGFIRYILASGALVSSPGCITAVARRQAEVIRRMYVINVVHTEANWWDDGYSGIDVGARELLKQLATLENAIGTRIPITWCLFFANGYHNPGTGNVHPDVVDTRRDFFHERLAAGDEVGIHPHAVSKEEQWRYIKENAEKLAGAGFPYPQTHAPGWFHLSGHVLRALEECHFVADAGVVVRTPEAAAAGRSADDPHSFRPYFPSYQNPYKPGECSVVELPLFLSYHGIGEVNGFVNAVTRQWAACEDGGMDVLQFFWHPFELVRQDGTPDDQVINGFVAVYRRISELGGCSFATASQATHAWLALKELPK